MTIYNYYWASYTYKVNWTIPYLLYIHIKSIVGRHLYYYDNRFKKSKIPIDT